MNRDHRPLGNFSNSPHRTRVYSASADAATFALLNHDVSGRAKKKSEVMILPSLQAVSKTAPNADRFGETLKTLFQWKKSIYKLVWKHMLIYYVLYVILSVIYEFALDEKGRRYFEDLVKYFSRSASTFNLMIMLGFFTSTTLQRLFTMQTAIPGTAKTISLFVMSLKPNLPEGSIIVNQYARWAVLSWILAIRNVSKPLRKKYPTMASLQIKGVLLERERMILEMADREGSSTPRPLIVIDWMLLLLKECHTYGRYNNKSCHHKNVELLMAFKKSCGNMIKFATKNIPLALIQAVILAVYYYGLVSMMARDLTPSRPYGYQQVKEIDPEPINGNNSDQDEQTAPENSDIVKFIISFIPIMPLMQFFIFFSWLTFGRMAVNPFGDDETDIDLRNLFDSHIEDYRRIGGLYKETLEDIFPNLPQKRYNELAKLPEPSPIDDSLEQRKASLSVKKVASTPEMKLLSIMGSTNSNQTNNIKQETAITIPDDSHSGTNTKWWIKMKNFQLK